MYSACTVRCYGGISQLKTASRQCPALAAALALDRQRASGNGASAQCTFSVVQVASHIRADSGRVKRQLKDLEWDSSGLALGGKWRRSGILVELSDLAFHVRMRADLTEAERDQALEFLHERCVRREANELQQLQRIHQALLSVSLSTVSAGFSSSCSDDDADDAAADERSDKLRRFIHDYFEEKIATGGVGHAAAAAADAAGAPLADESAVKADVRSLIHSYRDQTFSGRSIARIFHGIASPCFPAEVWGRAFKFWRLHLDKDFNAICRIASQELVALR